jgi:MFS family permease
MKKQILAFYGISFLWGLQFFIPIITFFYVQYIGFSLGWSIFLTTLWGLFIALLEIPTWALVDTYGRKRCYLVWAALSIFATLLAIYITNEWLFVLRTFIYALWVALMSGNLEALMHDNVKENWVQRELIFNRIQAHSMQYFFIGRAIAFAVAGILFVMSPLLPLIAMLIAEIVILVIVYLTIDDAHQHRADKTLIGHSRKTLRGIYTQRNIFFVIMSLAVISSIGNIYWFTFQPLLESQHMSIEQVGYFYGIYALLSAWGSYMLSRITSRYDIFGMIRVWFFLIFGVSIGFYIIWNDWLLLIPGIFLAIMFGMVNSVGNSYIIERVNPLQKSTALSIFSVAISVGYFMLSAPAGWFIEHIGISSFYGSIPFVVLFFWGMTEWYRRTIFISIEG